MADTKISALTAVASVTGTQELPANDGGTTKKMTPAQLLTYIEGAIGTAAFRALINDSDTTALRATLELVIGTNVQAYDAELAALAGLTSAADKGIQFTGAGTAGTFDLTAAGKALLDDAAASNQRTTLGLGTIATQDASSVSISGGSVTGITDLALADGGTGASLVDPNADRILFWDDSAGSTAFLTAGTNLTITGTTIDATGGSGAPTTAKYVTGAADAGLSAELVFPAMVDHPQLVPASPHADDEEFDSALSGSWAWINQTSAVQTIAGSHLIINDTPVISSQVRALTKDYTAGNFVFTTKYDLTAKWADYIEGGMALSDGTKITIFGPSYNGGLRFIVADWTNSSTFSATAYLGNQYAVAPSVYLRIQDDGTNHLFSVSQSGLPGSFVLLLSRSRTSFQTATKIGFGWRVTSGVPFCATADFLRRT